MPKISNLLADLKGTPPPCEVCNLLLSKLVFFFCGKSRLPHQKPTVRWFSAIPTAKNFKKERILMRLIWQSFLLKNEPFGRLPSNGLQNKMGKQHSPPQIWTETDLPLKITDGVARLDRGQPNFGIYLANFQLVSEFSGIINDHRWSTMKKIPTKLNLRAFLVGITETRTTIWGDQPTGFGAECNATSMHAHVRACCLNHPTHCGKSSTCLYLALAST